MELRELVDSIGDIDRQIEELKTKQDALKLELAQVGPGVYQGNEFVIDYKSFERSNVSWAKVAKELNPPEELVEKYTSSTVVNVFKISVIDN